MSEYMTIPEETAEESSTRPVTTEADAVIAAFAVAGIEHVFGGQGGAIIPVYDSPYHSDVQHVTMVHEQGAAHAADVYGIVSGNLDVCMATSDPGATNLVTGRADADPDSDPMVPSGGNNAKLAMNDAHLEDL